MDRLWIQGGHALAGSVAIEGAKNALLPLMTASLLTQEALTLKNVPILSDTLSLKALLESLGAQASFSDTSTLSLHAKHLTSYTAPYDIVRKMRASILVLGPLLARLGQACVSLPGGCAIGVRPVNLHIQALEALGASITLKEGYIHASCQNGLKGARYRFPTVSVTGTANLLMAATLAQGTTEIQNAAQEPEITDLIQCLKNMGAVIEGTNTSTLHVQGVTSLQGTHYTVLPDRIETGTYLLAAAITGSTLTLTHTNLSLLPLFSSYLQTMGITLHQNDNTVTVHCPPPQQLKPLSFSTQPYPGFPTDLQAQMMALLTCVPGASQVEETVFENRFMHIAELQRMGADIHIHHNTASITGQKCLKAAPVMATDIRASAGLVLAGLAAQGETTIQRIYHLDRGYARMEKKLQKCGAQIRRESA